MTRTPSGAYREHMSVRRLGHIAILIAAAAVLTGCGVVAAPRQTVLPTPPSGASPSSPAAPIPSQTPTSAPTVAPPAAEGTVVCGGGPTEISGADQDFVLTGDCAAVTIGGTGLRIDATRATLGVVQLSGDRNELTSADVADLSVGGQDNVIDAVALSSVALNGDRNTVTASGFTALTVSGNDNTVRADRRGTVTDNGQRNTVSGR